MVAYGAAPMLWLFATTTTTVEDVPRIVGDPLSWPVFLGAGILVFVLILAGGLWARRHRD
jgi:hypothetical protein